MAKTTKRAQTHFEVLEDLLNKRITVKELREKLTSKRVAWLLDFSCSLAQRLLHDTINIQDYKAEIERLRKQNNELTESRNKAFSELRKQKHISACLFAALATEVSPGREPDLSYFTPRAYTY